jgi:hypothetical protein
MVGGGFTGVRVVRMRVGDIEYGMYHDGGATYAASLQGHHILGVRFKIMYVDGTEKILRKCFSNPLYPNSVTATEYQWPVQVLAVTGSDTRQWIF